MKDLARLTLPQLARIEACVKKVKAELKKAKKQRKATTPALARARKRLQEHMS